jgi:vacuolar-type H+-ATPase subunit I/STV1|tara:strand:- start:243 stop:848 length:606 start_codon:yes stop_codon:yes gene_type:complete
MAFKMKNPSMAKMVKEAGSAMKKPLVGDQSKLNEGLKKAIKASPTKSKEDRVIKRMSKLQDKAQKLNKKGKDKRAQRKIDKMSKLEDKLLPGLKRPDPTFEGTDEFRSKREIRKAERKNRRARTHELKHSAMKLKEGEFTTSGIPANLFDADGKKISTDKIDEGNLSAVKVEKGTNRKYVVIQEKSVIGDAGGRLYLSNPK